MIGKKSMSLYQPQQIDTTSAIMSHKKPIPITTPKLPHNETEVRKLV